MMMTAMENSLMFLKPNVVFEPLVNGWYAWTNLISPATAAMYITEKHLTIMDSYVLAPDLHAESVLNPKMRGGPFMDFGRDRSGEVAELKRRTLEFQKKSIEFSSAIKELDKMLSTEAKGFGMEQLYLKVPDILRGYVELFYDRNNNPGFRFFDFLLFKSEFYNRDVQNIALWITNNDQRPFCLSTPRLEDDQVLKLNIAFDDPAIDALAKMKRTAGSLQEIERVLKIKEGDKKRFANFFSSVEPPEYSPYKGDKIRMRYFGHACILIETRDVSILVDPLISYYGYHSPIEHYSDFDLPEKIDYVLITHNHQDHVLLETLLPLRHRIGSIIVPRSRSGRLEDPDLKLIFNNIGFDNVIAADEMDVFTFTDTRITCIPFTGEHSDLNIHSKSCYLVQVSGFKLLFLADSRTVEPSLFSHIREQVGEVDVLFIGMECDGAPLSWLYGPLMTKKIPRDQDASRRLSGSDCKKGMAIVDIFKPKEVYVYAMGMEPWLEFISSIKYTPESNPIVQSNELVKLCREKRITAERLFGEKELLYDRKIDARN